MPAGASFADVLASKLTPAAAPVSVPRSWTDRPITPPLFAVADTRLHVCAAPPQLVAAEAPFAGAAPAGAADTAAPSVEAETAEPWFDEVPFTAVPRTRARVLPSLPPAARAALTALNALGAGLEPLPSHAALRQAFRRLARQYHPDRHHGAGAREHERLARVFAAATDHYRVLTAALDDLATRH